MIQKLTLLGLSFFFAAILFSKTTVVQAAEIRYAQCDVCGLCKNTNQTNNEVEKSIYQKPGTWDSCFRCLFPTLTEESKVACPASLITVKSFDGQEIADQECRTLLMDDNTNDFINKPQEGRQFSEVGCISAGTTFTDPDATVDVVKRMLDIVISVTGAIGLIFFLKGAFQLLTSRGNPDSIRAARKTLVSTLIGLGFTLFSLFIFRFIAQQALRIPGLG